MSLLLGACCFNTTVPLRDPLQWWIQDFPWGGVHPLGGRGPLTWALFGENVCKNKRIGSHGGGGVRRARPPQIRQCIVP